MEILNLKLSDAFDSMKQERLVDDHFVYLYSLKENVQDHFYLEIIQDFYSNIRDDLQLLTQKMNENPLSFELIKEQVYKIKGSCLNMGACRMVQASADFERATNMASKEECERALMRIKYELNCLQQKLHYCLQLERGIVLLASDPGNL